MNNGFLITATVGEAYQQFALNLIDSLDEHYPDAPVMVSTIPEWADSFKMYDNVVEIRSDGPNNIRNKLWALDKTPFDKTCYLDADLEIQDERIQGVWDLLDDDHDMAFTVICPPCGSTTAIYKEEGEKEIRDNNIERHLRYHGGFFLYHSNDTALKAVSMWWDKWQEINENPKWWDNHPEYFRPNINWDQFTWWYIITKLMPELKIQEIENNTHYQYQWNMNSFIPKFVDLPEDFEPIIWHHTAASLKMRGK